MHIPAHVLDPATCAATGAASTAAIGYALYRLKQDKISTNWPLLGLTGVSILVAQSLNFPIASNTSGHFLGGALAGILLGPWAGLLVMAAVITVQAVLLHDGGVAALGANILNMAVIGSLTGYGVYRLAAKLLAGQTLSATVLAAWCSVVASAVACSVELSLGANYPLSVALAAMLPIHAVIGLAEMAITGGVLLLTARRFMPLTEVKWRTAVIGLTCAALAAIVLSPLACSLPDGLENLLLQAGR